MFFIYGVVENDEILTQKYLTKIAELWFLHGNVVLIVFQYKLTTSKEISLIDFLKLFKCCKTGDFSVLYWCNCQRKELNMRTQFFVFTKAMIWVNSFALEQLLKCRKDYQFACTFESEIDQEIPLTGKYWNCRVFDL